MHAADTNVLVRIFSREEERQAAVADAFVQKGIWVSHLVLAETLWVLERTYQFDSSEIEEIVDLLLNHETVTLQEADVVGAALDLYRQTNVGFSDCLVLEIARKEGHLPLGTFDRDLGKLDGAERL
ncbi:MAG TPA: type II toxin-antitoxin system VapC family toxin [Thermoanaerobaculia bacterium]|jgi:predicted nucleic-acid-binding protein|nr:type II toxin-antitoxin system VapC family toxin [Thermoanaerobaculia bacterium]